LQKWLQRLKGLNAKLAIIELGAGHPVPTVRLQSQRINKEMNSTLIRINPRDYDVPKGAVGISLGAKEGINRILYGRDLGYS